MTRPPRVRPPGPQASSRVASWQSFQMGERSARTHIIDTRPDPRKPARRTSTQHEHPHQHQHLEHHTEHDLSASSERFCQLLKEYANLGRIPERISGGGRTSRTDAHCHASTQRTERRLVGQVVSQINGQCAVQGRETKELPDNRPLSTDFRGDDFQPVGAPELVRRGGRPQHRLQPAARLGPRPGRRMPVVQDEGGALVFDPHVGQSCDARRDLSPDALHRRRPSHAASRAALRAEEAEVLAAAKTHTLPEIAASPAADEEEVNSPIPRQCSEHPLRRRRQPRLPRLPGELGQRAVEIKGEQRAAGSAHATRCRTRSRQFVIRLRPSALRPAALAPSGPRSSAPSRPECHTARRSGCPPSDRRCARR